jgi:hypothetical protein
MAYIEFIKDVHIFLKPGVEYNNEEAWELLRKEIIEKIYIYMLFFIAFKIKNITG